jgi:heme/copper-type cytochrome/quinol oxidase subunit 2
MVSMPLRFKIIYYGSGPNRDERLSNPTSIDALGAFLLPLMKRTALLICFSALVLCGGCKKNPPADEHIPVVMKRYSIDPSEIRVQSGKRIELEVTSADVQHGLDIPALGIKEPVQPGRTTIISFTAPVPGEYRIACGVLCGPHHDDMVAKLIVQ